MSDTSVQFFTTSVIMPLVWYNTQCFFGKLWTVVALYFCFEPQFTQFKRKNENECMKLIIQNVEFTLSWLISWMALLMVQLCVFWKCWKIQEIYEFMHFWQLKLESFHYYLEPLTDNPNAPKKYGETPIRQARIHRGDFIWFLDDR